MNEKCRGRDAEREREKRCREKERLLDINMLTPCFLGGYPWQCHYDKPGTGSGHLSVLWYFVVNVGNQFLFKKKKISVEFLLNNMNG